MLFFSEMLSSFYRSFALLFGIGINEDDNEREEQGKEAAIETVKEESTDADKNFFILSLIKEYSDFTHIDFDRVWNKNICEFFNILAFIKEYKKREKEAIEKMMRKNGNRV